MLGQSGVYAGHKYIYIYIVFFKTEAFIFLGCLNKTVFRPKVVMCESEVNQTGGIFN